MIKPIRATADIASIMIATKRPWSAGVGAREDKRERALEVGILTVRGLEL